MQEDDPKIDSSLLDEGYRLGEGVRYEEAEVIFRKVLETEPESPDIWYAL